MIEQKETNNFVLICDNCGKEIEGFDCIDSACDYMESEGWGCEEGTKLDLTEGLMDICPKCMEVGDE